MNHHQQELITALQKDLHKSHHKHKLSDITDAYHKIVGIQQNSNNSPKLWNYTIDKDRVLNGKQVFYESLKVTNRPSTCMKEGGQSPREVLMKIPITAPKEKKTEET